MCLYDYSRTTGYEAAYKRYQQLQCYKGMKNNVAILLKPLSAFGRYGVKKLIGASLSEPLSCSCQWKSCTYVRAYVRPRPTTRLRMRERCSNFADLAGFRNQLVLQLFVSGQ